MKGLAAFLLFMAPFMGYAEKKIFHYTPDGKTYFDLSDKKVLIKFAGGVSFEEQSRILSNESILAPLTKEMVMPAPKVVIAELKSGTSENEILTLIERLNKNASIEYSNPFMVFEDGTLEAALDRVVIKLRHSTDFGKMEQMVKNNNAIIQEQYKYDPLLYFIQVNKNSTARALELANIWAEAGTFEYSEPDKLKLLKRYYSTNDTYLNYQWALNNTGSSIQYNGTAGGDMKVFAAWDVSRGSSTIKVAIIDEGVDLNHADLLANMLPGFDGTGLGSAGGPSGNDAHGTNCAGIVAAVGNNNLGIAGVAHLCKIIPVRIAYSSGANWVTSNSIIGTSLDWAWNQGGADVLSNSWGGGSSSALINDPIGRAVTQGRGGLGSPVLFAAGNSNGANSYPATLANTISVVAMSMCQTRKTPSSCDGETWWGSNFGTGVDVAAPGVKIYSTDISGSAGYNTSSGTAGDYYATFNGTSSACPNAAGVMALILSVNPSLSNTQARQILESTCRKVGGYTYNSGVSGQPNGTWSTDLGHGMVDAFSAVQAANPQPCTTPTVGGTATGPSSFAAGSNGTFTLTGFDGTDIQWQSSTNGGTTYNDIGGATNASSTFTLAGGTYKIRAAVSRINCTTSYSNILDLTVTTPVGDILANPIVATLPYSTSISNATGFTNAYTGTNNQASPDIFFRFTTGPCTDSVAISTCASGFDTYLHLLSSTGTWIVSNDDNGPYCSGTRASIKRLVSPNTTYYVVAEGYSTGTGAIALTINEIDNPVYSVSITPGSPTTFCSGGSVTLTATAGSSYLWSTGATTQSIVASSTGTYSCTVTNSNGCSASANQSVTVNLPPTVSISANGPTSFCQGGSVMLTASSGSSYLWSTGATSQSITVNATGTYSCSVTNANGCSASANQSVTVNPLPIVSISAGGPTTFCQGGSVLLTASSGASYLWSTGATTQSITVNASGTYSCTVTNGNGCSAPASQGVTVNPLPTMFTTSGGGSYCSVPGTGTTVNLSGSQSGVNYDFKFTAGGTAASLPGTGSSLSATNITGNGTVYVVATDATTGCSRNMNGSASVFEQQATTWYRDFDGDGYGNSAQTTQACSAPLGYVSNNQDCDDNNNNVNPGASEVCGNGIDDNCNGQIDEGCTVYTFYRDADNDTYGDPNVTTTSGNPAVPAGYVTNNDDCDDGNSSINPGASEICNGIDDNCDGIIDNGTPALASATLISGPAGVCRNSSGHVFSVASIPGATSYIWTLPTGATGSSTTNSITVAFSSSYVTGNICVRAANSCLEGSNFCRSVTYYSAKPGTPVAISGQAAGVCENSVQTYTIAAVTNATNYTWAGPAGSVVVSGQGTTTASIQFPAGFVSGSVTVNASNCVGTSANRSLTVSRTTGVPASIAGPLFEVCAGGTYNFICPTVNGATQYTWGAPVGSTIIGQGTNNVQITMPTPFASGALTVASGTTCFTSGNRSITVRSIPTTPASISGTLLGVCAGSTQTYTCPTSTTGATYYNWTLPTGSTDVVGQGTNSISFTLPGDFGATGTLSVVAGNACGSSTARSVTLRSIPSTPGTITGPTTAVCGTKSYSIALSTTGATGYTWSGPSGSTVANQGSNQVDITFPDGYVSGSVAVVANNACGNSAAKTLAVRSVPVQPGVITGQTANLCGTNAIYTVASVATATSYNWTAPGTASVSQNNGTSAELNFPVGFVSGNVSVAAVNGCGAGPVRNLAVVGKPATPASISGPTSVCPGASGLVYTTPETAGFTYTWTKPTSVAIVSGQGTPSLTLNWGSVAGSITVKATNSCGTSATRSLAVTMTACRNGKLIDFSEETVEDASVLAYPNPSNGIYQISLSGIANDGLLQIFNMQGKLVYSQKVEQGLSQTEVNLTGLSAGAYLLRFQSDGFQKDLKLIKE